MNDLFDALTLSEAPQRAAPLYPDMPRHVTLMRRDYGDLLSPQAHTIAHGRAVLAAIRALNSPPRNQAPAPRAPCVSGTWESDGRKILAHIRRANAARLQSLARADRARRTDAELIAAYDTAMSAKRRQA